MEIRPEDIEMQVYRSPAPEASTSTRPPSAVRLIHKPTGVVASQQERSQFQNKDNCMKMLRAKLVELQMRRTRRRSPTSRAFSSRLSGAARSVPMCLCPISW